jgi:hypothetical protein
LSKSETARNTRTADIFWLSTIFHFFCHLLEWCRAIIKSCRADFSSNRNSSSSPCPLIISTLYSNFQDFVTTNTFTCKYNFYADSFKSHLKFSGFREHRCWRGHRRRCRHRRHWKPRSGFFS